MKTCTFPLIFLHFSHIVPSILKEPPPWKVGELLPLAERLKKIAERLRKLGTNGVVGKQMLVLDSTLVLRFLGRSWVLGLGC